MRLPFNTDTPFHTYPIDAYISGVLLAKTITIFRFCFQITLKHISYQPQPVGILRTKEIYKNTLMYRFVQK